MMTASAALSFRPAPEADDVQAGAAAADIRLSSFLEKHGRMETARLGDAQRWAASQGVSLVQALEQRGVVDVDELAKSLASRLRLPVLDLTTLALDDCAIRSIDEDLALRHDVVAVRSGKGNLVLAMANPFDLETMRKIEFATGKRVRPAVATRLRIREAVERHRHLDRMLDAFLANLPASPPIAWTSATADGGVERPRPVTLPSVAQLLGSILAEAVEAGASEVRLEPGRDFAAVRMLKTGCLQEITRLPKWVHGVLAGSVRESAGLERDCRSCHRTVRICLGECAFEVRVSSVETVHGEQVVISFRPEPAVGADPCPHCSSPVEAGFALCPSCLRDLLPRCVGCDAPLEPEVRRCGWCGGTAAPSPTVAGARRDGQTFQVAEAPLIVVVDGHEDHRVLLKDALETDGTAVRVELAATTEQGLALIEHSRPHLVILDLMIWGAEGFEVRKRLRSRIATAFLPIVVYPFVEGDGRILSLASPAAPTTRSRERDFYLPDVMSRTYELLRRTYGYEFARAAIKDPSRDRGSRQAC